MEKNTFVESNTTRVFNKLNFSHKYASFFSLYLGHAQACQQEE